MAEQQIVGFPVRPAPNSRVTKDSEDFELLAVNATFDGSAASADFVPAVEVVSDAGRVVGRFPTDAVVAAGGSAEVTFAPFLRAARGFIRFLVNNVGGWLNVTARWQAFAASAPQTTYFGPAAILLSSEGTGAQLPIVLRTSANGTTYAGELALSEQQLQTRGLDLETMDVNGDEMLVLSGAAAAVNHSFKSRISGTGTFTVQDFGFVDLLRIDADGTPTFILRAGTSFVVQDDGFQPIFEVRDDGSLHGKTGKALTFDL